MRHRTAGRVVGVVLAPAALLGLSSCTPAAKPLVAVHYVDGRPTALVVNCDEVSVRSIAVSDVTTDPATAKWVIRRGAASAANAVTLLDAPSGWTVDTETLTGFSDGRKYTINAFTQKDPAAFVRFTLDQLKGLRSGQVVTAEGEAGSKVVSEKQFRKDAQNSC